MGLAFVWLYFRLPTWKDVARVELCTDEDYYKLRPSYRYWLYRYWLKNISIFKGGEGAE